jgi:hypothetical protein
MDLKARVSFGLPEPALRLKLPAAQHPLVSNSLKRCLLSGDSATLASLLT